jgi:tRNA (cytidine56-2'-O)-methyltransferase
MIEILRVGHRVSRDKRISTHVALVARAFGADRIVFSGQRDDDLIKNVNDVVERFGGPFEIIYERNWKKYLEERKKKGFKIVHLTMYGLPFREKINEVRGDLVVVVGGEKVPGEIYRIADYNLGVTNQPHSEVGALAVFLDCYFKGKYKEFKGKLRIKPSARGKEFY